MIIVNGAIQFIRKMIGKNAIDPKTGYPVKPGDQSWCRPIPCQIIPVRTPLRVVSNGEVHTEASYTILIEEQPLPDSEQILVSDSCGRPLGEFSLLCMPEHLAAVCQIRLTV